MSWSLAAIVGLAAGSFTLLVVTIVLLCLYLFRRRALMIKNSDTGSSDPPTVAEWSKGGLIASSGGGGPPAEHQGRQFRLEELEQATRDFSDSNIVGTGSFGMVYKGLLLDGTIVAIKRRIGAPRRDFVEEVNYVSAIWHRNLVTLIGYCQEGDRQMLVSEYLPNGSVCRHLYDTGQDSSTKLEFKQRLSVAIGAAKGLSHLHSLVPPLIHKSFKTNNVLVDENFIAKVADAGIVRLLERIDNSQTSVSSVFQDPEVGGVQALSETSDVYSFGVFLLELITGLEAGKLAFPLSDDSLSQWVESHLNSGDLIDPRLDTSFTSEGMKALIELTLQCLNSSGIRRPKMSNVVTQLDRILETEMTLTTVMGDGTAIVTLGSQLFTS